MSVLGQFTEALEAHGSREQSRGNWQCPAHEDRAASLSVSEGADGRVLVHCHAGCEADAVAGSIGWRLADLFEPQANGRRRIVATYDYTDENGEPLFQAVRFEPKDFRQRRPDGRGGWEWTLGDTRRVLYRLPAVVAAVTAGSTVYVCEGEKDAHALEAAGVVATCNPMGAGKWRDGYAEPLRGADVVVVQDKDDPGRDHVADVLRSLARVDASVRLVEAMVGKDAADHLAAGRTVAEFVAVETTTTSGDAPTVTPKLRVLDTRWMVDNPPPPIEWLADGVFARGKFTLFGGREKGGKSLVQAAIGRMMARGGGELAGIQVAPGRVLYIDAENGEEEIHRRIHTLELGVKGAHAITFVEARGFDLNSDLRDVEALIDEHTPDLVLLDSYRALWRGDECDEAAIGAALYPLSALAHDRGIAVGLTHHATKGEGDYRGSTAIGAVPDWICLLSRDRDDPRRGTRRRLTTPYARFAPERDDRWLEICSEGDDGPVWLTACDAFVPQHDAPVRDGVEAELVDLLETRWQGGKALVGGCHLPPPPWTAADLARAVGREPKDRTIRRALEDLADDGLVARGEDKRWHPLGAFFHRNGTEAR